MDRFRLEIFDRARADVCLVAPEAAVPWDVVEGLDRAAIRAVGRVPDAAPDGDPVRGILGGCSGLVTVSECRDCGRMAADLGIPFLDLGSGAADLVAFQSAVLADGDRMRPYAFLIGRLERDFAHAREAIRAGVEAAAGLPCLWADDGRHRTNIESVRERTRLLIKHATFVIADLTLGVESPERENPSRAHEIGMAIAYERPLMLCSQEPRRYPYFSIGDMQMSFWSTEDELEADVERWVQANREAVARRVYNYQLAAPVISKPSFTFDPARRFLGPKMKVPLDVRRVLARMGLRRP